MTQLNPRRGGSPLLRTVAAVLAGAAAMYIIMQVRTAPAPPPPAEPAAPRLAAPAKAVVSPPVAPSSMLVVPESRGAAPKLRRLSSSFVAGRLDSAPQLAKSVVGGPVAPRQLASKGAQALPPPAARPESWTPKDADPERFIRLGGAALVFLLGTLYLVLGTQRPREDA